MIFNNNLFDINLSDINLNDDLFRFSYPDENAVLEKSITEHGLIYPIIVKKRLKKFQIICGFRRTLIAKKLNYKHIPAIITSENDKESFAFAVSDTLSQRSLNIFEISTILNKLIDRFGINKTEAESVYLPIFGYNPNKNILDNLLFIKKFSNSQRKNLFSLNIEPEKIFVFKMMDKPVWDELIKILDSLRPSTNKFRQIIELIKEISQRENIKETELLTNHKIQSIIKNDKKTSSQNLNSLRNYLE
ncbi:ParB N-terminal domain-containing protein, partial [bacterium]|nr:ParB N-terminal domain-containing protein [bacterium]